MCLSSFLAWKKGVTTQKLTFPKTAPRLLLKSFSISKIMCISWVTDAELIKLLVNKNIDAA